MKTQLLAIAATAAVFAGCSKPHGWTVEGEVVGTDDYGLALEGFNNGAWYLVDSLQTNDGYFKYNSAAPAAYPEIMRLSLNGNAIYFPIDSVDRVEILTYADNFSTSYEMTGSQQARTVKSLDSLINLSVAERGVAVTASDPTLKRELFVRAFEDSSVLPLYYLVNRPVGQTMLFDKTNSEDLRMYGAVAQRFATERPDDPRGQLLAADYKKAKAAQKGEYTELLVPEASLIEIERADRLGKNHSLSELASQGKVVLLSFTAYSLENSPEYNLLLNMLYDEFHAKGLEIYQIAFDGDETAWKETARNLPWTAVWNSTTDGTAVLANYNVGALPTTFIIDRNGTVVERVEDPLQLEKLIQKYL